MSVRRGLSWIAIVAGVALAVALSIWLIGEQARLGARDGAVGQPVGKRSFAGRPRVEIPKIDVKARVIKLGLERDGSLEVPKDYSDVGVWEDGPQPGERGAAVLAGHVDTPTAPAVFYELRKLRRGDRVHWFGENGVVATFVVTRFEQHPKAQFPTKRVYGKTRRRELRIITCTGPADPSGRRSLDNLIVYARRARST
jgi:sortase (surface protein transpeptidase)